MPTDWDSILPELTDLMPHTITYEPPAGVDDWGNATYGTAVTYQCHIMPMNGERIIRRTDGSEQVSKYKIFINGSTALDTNGRLTLPAGFSPTQPAMLVCALYADEHGAHHVEVTV